MGATNCKPSSVNLPLALCSSSPSSYRKKGEKKFTFVLQGRNPEAFGVGCCSLVFFFSPSQSCLPLSCNSIGLLFFTGVYGNHLKTFFSMFPLFLSRSVVCNNRAKMGFPCALQAGIFQSWNNLEALSPISRNVWNIICVGKNWPLVVDPESITDLTLLEQRGGLWWEVQHKWDRADQCVRGECGDAAGQSEGVATAATLSTRLCQSPLVPLSGSCWHSCARGWASNGSSFQTPGCRGILQAKVASQDWGTRQALEITSKEHREDDLFQNCLLSCFESFNCSSNV